MDSRAPGTSPVSAPVARLRRSALWPPIRRIVRPARARLRAASAIARSRRRHLRATTLALRARALGRARTVAHAHPSLTAATLGRARRLVAAGAVRTRAIGRLITRDPPARAWFDAAWYRSVTPDLTGDAWTHHLTVGARGGEGKKRGWDVALYRYDHPDTADFGDDVLAHWLARGRAAGATPHPLFDPDWYRRAHPEMGRSDPYLHYLRVGRAAGHAPSAALEPGVDLGALHVAFPEIADPAVTVIIPGYRSAMRTFRCLAAVAAYTPAALRAHVCFVDDDPTRPVAPLLADIPGLEVRVNPTNLGFLRSCNAAVAQARGEHVVLLNNDTVVTPGWLDALLAPVREDPRAVLVGSRLLEPDGRLQEAGVIMEADGWGIPFGRGEDPERSAFRYRREVDAVTGACLLVRRSAWEAAGGFDEAYAPAYFEEYDLAFRLRAAGGRVVYAPEARVIHAGSGSYGTEARDRQTKRNHERFVARFATTLAEAPPVGSDRFLSRQRDGRPAAGTILVVDDRVPEPDQNAGALTMRLTLELLVAEGMRVILLPADGRDRPGGDALRAMGVEVLSGEDPDAWLDAHGRHLDWVLVARPLVADRVLPAVRRWTDARVAYYTHDLHFLRERRRAELTGDPRARADARYLEEVEGAVLRSVDVILTPSAAELPHIAALAPGTEARVMTPWPYPPGRLAPVPGPPMHDRREIVFVGAFEHLPNVDAALFLVREVMPRVWAEVPDAHVTLVGADPPPEVGALASARVSVAGWVADLDACHATARVALCPLRYGAGVKGKIVAALVAGVPVVTTSIGDEGLGLSDGIHALLADDADGLARQTLALMRDAGLAQRLADAGRAFAVERFSAARGRADLLAALGPPRSGRA